MDPTFFVYHMSDPLVEEKWGQGMVIFHNPNALYPVPKDFFLDALQGYLEDDKYKADVPYWHPYTSMTRSLHFSSPASRPGDTAWPLCYFHKPSGIQETLPFCTG